MINELYAFEMRTRGRKSLWKLQIHFVKPTTRSIYFRRNATPQHSIARLERYHIVCSGIVLSERRKRYTEISDSARLTHNTCRASDDVSTGRYARFLNRMKTNLCFANVFPWLAENSRVTHFWVTGHDLQFGNFRARQFSPNGDGLYSAGCALMGIWD